MVTMEFEPVHDIEWLLEAEQAEQSLWMTTVVPWHPRCDGDPEPDPPVEEDPPVEDEDDEFAGMNEDQINAKKAHLKLRESEKRERKTQADLRKAQQQGLSENEKLKSDLAAAQAESAATQEILDRIETDKEIARVAKSLKFRNAEKAGRFVTPGSTTEKDIRRDLREALSDYPELSQEASPPPPVNDASSNSPGSSNNRMNDAIRAAAGRG